MAYYKSLSLNIWWQCYRSA